ncbi:MAG: hypothetical protein ACM3XR_09390 [Bacillota bacterium]
MEWEEYFSDYINCYTNGINLLPECKEDLDRILRGSGYEQAFIRLFRMRIRFLAERGKSCHLKSDWFEILINTNELYSMKFIGIKSKRNIRILFIFRRNGKNLNAILVHAFEEKENKKKSKTSYNKATNIANKRILLYNL